MHLPVAGHDGDDVGAEGEGAAVAGDDGGAHAAVLRVADHLDARVAGAGGLARGAVAARVVDDDDVVDEGRHARHGLRDPALLVVGGDDDGDAGALEHGIGGRS